MRLDPLGGLLLLRDFKLDELLSLLNIASELLSLLIIIAPEEADFSLLITSLLFAGLADFLLLLFDLPERSKCSDLDLGMAELMQSANRSSSSCPVLSRLSMERSEREELKLLFAFFASNDFGARPAVSDAPVEDPELPDLGKIDFFFVEYFEYFKHSPDLGKRDFDSIFFDICGRLTVPGKSPALKVPRKRKADRSAPRPLGTQSTLEIFRQQ